MISFSEILQKDKRSLDERQMQAVMCNDNCVVSAGAGSGKTTVLSYRFLRLVCDGVPCDRILTLTFTEKAASEMKERIYQRLLSCADVNVLKTFEKASVSTIDSFCASVARSGCQAYGISPEFTIMDDEDYKKALMDKVQQALENPRYAKAVDFLIRNYSPDSVQDAIYDMSRSCFRLVKTYDAQSATQEAMDFFRLARDKALGDLDQLCSDYRADLGSLEDFIKASDAAAMALTGNMSALEAFGFSSKRGSKDIAEAFKAFKDSYKDLRSQVLCSVQSLGQGACLRGFYDFLFDLRDSVLSDKRTAGKLLFEDVSDLALEILKTSKAARAYYKGRFDYIMIDEFQDNNKKQKDLMFLLAEKLDRCSEGVPESCDLEKGKLFFVGDQKQSIYLFRGADVSVFKGLSDEMRKCSGTFLELETNYRSNPALINDFNKLFPFIMSTGSRPSSYEASFEGLGSGRKPSLNWSFRLAYLPYDKDKADDEASSLASEAEYVASLIERMLGSDDYLIEGKDGRLSRPRPSDIAILFRTLGCQSHFEKALRKSGIPASLAESRSLFTDAVASDFYCLLQLCLYPDDRLALASALGSPLCPLEESVRYEALSSPDKMDRIDNPMLKAFLKSLEALRIFARTASLSQIINYIWSAMGYRAHLIARSSGQFFLNQYDFLLGYALDMERKGMGLVQLVSWMRGLLGTMNKSRDVSVYEEGIDGVQMMTIHKSKGLEFPIVFVCGAGTSSSNRPDSYALIGNGCPLPNHIVYQVDSRTTIRNLAYKSFKRMQDAYEVAELKRLIYVAFTRAECHLVVTGSQTKVNQEASKGTDPSLDFSVMLNYMLSGFTDASRIDIIPSVLQADTYSPLSKAEHLEQGLKWLQDSEPVIMEQEKPTVAVTEYIGHPEPGSGEALKALESDDYILKEKKSDSFGTLVHRIIELRIKDLEDPEDLMDDFKSAGLQMQRQVYEDACLLAQGFLSSSLYKSLEAYEVQSEQRFFMGVDGKVLEGVADLVARRLGETVIIDFKTDRRYDPLVHKSQLEIYMKAFRASRAAVCYLRDPDRIIWWEA